MNLSTAPPAAGEKPNPTLHPNAKKLFTDWRFEQYDMESFTGVMNLRRQRSPGGAELLQNCDLPPPLKFFSPMETISNNMPAKQAQEQPVSNKVDEWEDELKLDRGDEDPSLVRALQRSQTRAREAEKKFSLESERSKQMTNLIFKDSMILYAHRQWIKLLETEMSMIKKRLQIRNERAGEEEDLPLSTWCWTMAFCISIAGVGFALGHYLF